MKKALETLIDQSVREYARAKGLELPAGFAHDLVGCKDTAHGDYASNLAFKLSKVARMPPSAIAAELTETFRREAAKQKTGILDRIEVAGGGFINFYLLRGSLGQVLITAHEQGDRFGESAFGRGKKTLLEFVSANPTGPLTIAHGRQAAVGDALARILRATGHEVSAEYYLNDAGRQMNLLGASAFARYKEKLGQPLVLPEDGYQGTYLVEIAEKLVGKFGQELLKRPADQAIDECRRFTGSDIMEGIRRDLQDTRVSFDSYFNESSLYQNGAVEETLKYLKDKDFLFEQEGALWFRSTAFGDDKDRVVRKSTGEYTYLAPDIAYHRHKFLRGYNWLINFLGPDHHGYIARLKAACQALGHDASQIQVRIVQLTTLYRQGQPVRMSTRAGEFVTLRELLDDVGADATRFFFVMRKIDSHLDFDLDLAKAKSQENPVYYLQYAHARIASLIKFAERKVTAQVNLDRLSAPEEIDLIRCITAFPDTLIRASQNLEPHTLSDYLKDLAASFHKFYNFHRVVTDDEELTAARLLLADAARVVLKNGLRLLGISQPESM